MVVINLNDTLRIEKGWLTGLTSTSPKSNLLCCSACELGDILGGLSEHTCRHNTQHTQVSSLLPDQSHIAFSAFIFSNHS
jgi:hypothetical protein